MEDYTRSDLACESGAMTGSALPKEIYSEEWEGEILLSRLHIATKEQGELFGKPTGHYITAMCGKIWLMDEEELALLAEILAREMRIMASRMCRRTLDKTFGVLVVGLGNAEITPDAIGPRTVMGLTVTRHLRGVNEALYKAVGRCEISAFSPGVLGQTGMETVELVRGAVQTASPSLVVAIDALAARSCERLATTVQLSDSGICPGSGIGNERKGIIQDNVGVPVLAVGVPTVVCSSALVYDALTQAGIENVSEELEAVLENGRSFFVSPKETDIITKQVAALLSAAIDLAFTPEE